MAVGEFKLAWGGRPRLQTDRQTGPLRLDGCAHWLMSSATVKGLSLVTAASITCSSSYRCHHGLLVLPTRTASKPSSISQTSTYPFLLSLGRSSASGFEKEPSPSRPHEQLALGLQILYFLRSSLSPSFLLLKAKFSTCAAA